MILTETARALQISQVLLNQIKVTIKINNYQRSLKNAIKISLGRI